MYTTTNTSYSLKIDQNQALRHFKALGYEQGDKIYVRYIHPVSKKSIKAAKLDFNSANHYQAQGYDVYFVVNGGGDTDSAVTQCLAIFYEHDNLDKSIQLKLWQTLELPEPTIQVDTGGKSIHSYWVFDTPIAPKQWKELQTDLLEFSDGDRALKNPSRILRLAGSWYMKGDKPGTTQAALVSNSGKRYSYEQLRGAIPIKQTPALELALLQQITQKTGSSVYTSTYQGFEDIQVPVPESVPIYNCLSKESRALIESGVSADRNVNGAKLARDLIGTANYLRSIGQAFDGDEWQLFTDYGYRCPPGDGWGESELQSIWKSAQGNNPSPSCKAEGVETCVKAWYWNNHVKQARAGGDRSLTSTPNSGNVVAMPTKYSTLEAAVEAARKVLQAKHSELTENIELEKVRITCTMSSYDWERKIIKPLKKELDGDRFRLDLLNLLAIDDEVERLRQQAMLAPKYQMSTSTLDKALQLIKQRTTTPKPQWFDLDSFFDQESQGLKWVIPELLPVGETIILAGAPKSGKTLLAIDAAFAVATGESTFLKEAVTQGRVLIISVDESAHSTKAKLIKRGFRRSDASHVQVMTNFDLRQMKALEERLEVFRPTLVIIDSLRRISQGQQISENSAEFADNIYTIKELLTTYKAAGILIHHTSKNQEAMGVDKIRGSSAISGAAWGTWQLDHIPKPDHNNKKKLVIDPKDPQRILSVFSRDAEGQHLRIEFNPEDNSWVNQGEIGETEGVKADRDTVKDQIFKVLELNAHRSGLSGKEIIELIDGASGGSIYTTLNRMVNKKLISARPAPGNQRFTLYSLPSPPPTPSVLDVICEAETNTQQNIQTYNTSYNTLHNKHITATELESDVIRSNPLPLSLLASHITPDRTEGGGGCGDSPEQLPTPETLAAQITKCQSWLVALELIDDLATKRSLKRGTILKILLNKCLNHGDRQYLLNLLNAHVAQFPEDERALKAQKVANSNNQQGEKLEKQII